jgi:hypothetical protein
MATLRVMLQEQLDKQKYIDSEKAEKDLCGTYAYCYLCNKNNKYPCSTAFIKFKKKYENKEVLDNEIHS